MLAKIVPITLCAPRQLDKCFKLAIGQAVDSSRGSIQTKEVVPEFLTRLAVLLNTASI